MPVNQPSSPRGRTPARKNSGARTPRSASPEAKSAVPASLSAPSPRYADFEAFKKEIRPLMKKEATSEDIFQGKSYGHNTEDQLKAAYTIYEALRGPHKTAIIGRLKGTEGNLYITEEMKDNVDRAYEETDPSQEAVGYILNTELWTPLINDAFILGCIHGGADVYLASLRTKENIAGKLGNTVTAREMHQLVKSKYDLLSHTTLGEVFCPKEETGFSPETIGFPEMLQFALDLTSNPRNSTKLHLRHATPVDMGPFQENEGIESLPAPSKAKRQSGIPHNQFFFHISLHSDGAGSPASTPSKEKIYDGFFLNPRAQYQLDLGEITSSQNEAQSAPTAPSKEMMKTPFTFKPSK